VGVGPRHAKLWRDKSGNWLKPLDGHGILLNSVPVSARTRTKLFKGDSLVFGDSPKYPEFWVLCRRAIEVAEDGQSLSARSESSGQTEDVSAGNGFKELSRAEYDVMAWMARGVVEVEDISRQLFRSVNTVRTQLSKIYEKIGVHSRAELLGLLIRNSNAIDRQKRNVSQLLGECACSNGFATGNSMILTQAKSQAAVSE